MNVTPCGKTCSLQGLMALHGDYCNKQGTNTLIQMYRKSWVLHLQNLNPLHKENAQQQTMPEGAM